MLCVCVCSPNHTRCCIYKKWYVLVGFLCLYACGFVVCACVCMCVWRVHVCEQISIIIATYRASITNNLTYFIYFCTHNIFVYVYMYVHTYMHPYMHSNCVCINFLLPFMCIVLFKRLWTQAVLPNILWFTYALLSCIHMYDVNTQLT